MRSDVESIYAAELFFESAPEIPVDARVPLASGTAREESRAEVAPLVERVLAGWKRG